MKIDDRFYKKYGANTVILPPPSEEELDQELPIDEVSEDISLKPTPLPEIKAPTEKEMKFWEQWLSARNNLKDVDLGGSSGETDSTIPPPGKKASSDNLLKMCSKYYDLCSKL